MTPLLINIALGLGWAALWGEMTAGQLVIGFILGYIVIGIHQKIVGDSSYYGKVSDMLAFILYFLKELVMSSLWVAYQVLAPSSSLRPGIVAVPLDAKTEFEIVILANVISLTPGTLSLDVSDDRSTLFVHFMDVESAEAGREEIKQGLEKRVLELMR